MISFLFWNLMGNQADSWNHRADHLKTRIGRMARKYDVDVFLFAESAFDPGELVATLNLVQVGTYTEPQSNNEKIQLITRLPRDDVVSQFDSLDDRLTIRHLIGTKPQLLLAVLHFHSLVSWEKEDQMFEVMNLHEDIVRVEDKVGHRRTILAGDLNMNPFDAGVVAARGLNAVMTRQLAERGERTVARRTYRLFYNPMWGHFGDRTAGPPGTLYYSSAAHVDYFWHMFDQVLLRPELIGLLEQLNIIDSDGEESLLTDQGRPRRSVLSDHLPILVRLRAQSGRQS